MVAYDEREWWIDYAKTIGIFLVVFIHLILSYKGNFIIDRNILIFGNVFHMPLFSLFRAIYIKMSSKNAVRKYF